MVKDNVCKGENVHQIVSVQYHNVIFFLKLKNEFDKHKFHCFSEMASTNKDIRLKDIHNWCRNQGVEYQTRFKYRKDYPLKANLWNYYTYLRSWIEVEF